MCLWWDTRLTFKTLNDKNIHKIKKHFKYSISHRKHKSKMHSEPFKPSNKTLPIFLENSYESLLINEVNLELSALDSLNTVGELFVVFSLWASTIVGSYFKIPLYHYMYDKIQNKTISSIDVLILVNGIIQHCACLILAVVYGIGILFDITFSHHIGETWCNVPWYAGVFGSAYRTMGSLGIAIIRLLYIKCSHWVTYRFGQKNMLALILTMGIIISVGASFAFGIGNGPASRKQVTWNWCIGRNEEFRETVHDYGLLTGQVSPSSDLVATMSLLAMITGLFVELWIYVVFFGHLYSHDTRMLNRKVLSTRQVTKRRQKNVVTFLGQFYGFVVEFCTYLGFLYTFKKSSNITFRVAIAIGYWVEFGFASIIEVMTSQNLRQYLPHNRHT